MVRVTDNKPRGGAGGTDFGHDLWRETPVTELEAWYGRGYGDQDQYTILKGLRVHWGNDEAQKGTTPDQDQDNLLHTSYKFSNGERVHWADVYGATVDSGRADAFRFDANDHFAAGGTGGDKGIQDIGDGTFFGFIGKGDGDIDSLAAVFQDE